MPTEPVLTLRQVFRASAERLFDAWTRPELMARWFHGRPTSTTEIVTCDLRAGGAWELVMHDPEIPACRCFGVYRTIDRPRLLVFTWHSFGRDDYETEVTLTFIPRGPGETELVLEHRGLRSDADREDHRLGWQGCCENLQKESL